MDAIIRSVLSKWPDHEKYLSKSFTGRDQAFLEHSERLSAMVLRLSEEISGGLDELAEDYRYLCEDIILPEEKFFRRNNHYRLQSFEEALSQVYGDGQFMTRYMNGLLLSDILWSNHCAGLQHYASEFLPESKSGTRFLEIGPGHGLLLALASQTAQFKSLSAWDVSEASIEMSRQALKTLQVNTPVSFRQQDIFDPAITSTEWQEEFDAIVLSEVLEHLERPDEALRALYSLCAPGGRVWINVPANSPAPDHLFLIRNPIEAEELVSEAGFEVIDTRYIPMTGYTLERAIQLKLTITCIVVGRRPPV